MAAAQHSIYFLNLLHMYMLQTTQMSSAVESFVGSLWYAKVGLGFFLEIECKNGVAHI